MFSEKCLVRIRRRFITVEYKLIFHFPQNINNVLSKIARYFESR
jgi:hypothetical protein